MARNYRVGDRVFAFTERPNLVLSLTYNSPEQWTVMVFDFTEKKAAVADHAEPNVELAKRFAGTFVAEHYGVQLGELDWREVLVIRPAGPSG